MKASLSWLVASTRHCCFWLSGLPYWRAALDCYIHALATCAGAQHAVVTCAGAQHAVAILLEHDDSDMAGVPHGTNWTTMSPQLGDWNNFY